MLDKLTSADFSAHLDSPFRIHVSGRVGGHADVTASALDPVEAELIEVSELGSDGSPDQEGAQRRPFSLVFRGPPNVVLPQRIYPVEHADLGTLHLFLVPLGPDRVGMRYEAVFN